MTILRRFSERPANLTDWRPSNGRIRIDRSLASLTKEGAHVRQPDAILKFARSAAERRSIEFAVGKSKTQLTKHLFSSILPPMAHLQTTMSAAEREARVDLAALYRLVALQGWDDLIFTHISMRVPGPDNHFLINPFGMMFEEVTASSLVKVDMAGQPVDPRSAMINPAGFVIHSAIHMAREDAHCVVHLHTIDGAALSTRAEGLLPLTQHAMIIGGELAYHDYEGVALDLDERERLVADLGSRHLMILRNHGTMAVGPNCGAAWLLIYYLERACSMQLRAMGDESAVSEPGQGIREKVRGQSAAWFDGTLGAHAWPSFLRRLDRIDAGFRN